MERAYQHWTRLIGLVVAGLGVALVVTTISRGGGPLSLGVVIGVCFTAFGIGRTLLAGGGREKP